MDLSQVFSFQLTPTPLKSVHLYSICESNAMHTYDIRLQYNQIIEFIQKQSLIPFLQQFCLMDTMLYRRTNSENCRNHVLPCNGWICSWTCQKSVTFRITMKKTIQISKTNPGDYCHFQRCYSRLKEHIGKSLRLY